MSLRVIFFLLAVMLHGKNGFAQSPDSLIINDSSSRSSVLAVDSMPKVVDSTAIKYFLTTQRILQRHPYYNFKDKAAPLSYTEKKKANGKEMYFYALAGLLLVFAVFRTTFDKYFADLMQLFFRRSMKQRQLKQTVSQNALPSLFFNIFYVLVAGFYIALFVKEVANSSHPFLQLLIYCIGFVATTYIVKYLILKFTGWMFHLIHLTNSYIFLVFLVNKVIGVVLLPVIVVIALGNVELRTSALALSWIALAGLFIYRFVQAFGLLRKEKSISGFHFILYLLAFEILPILVIYKVTSQYLQYLA